MWLYRGLKALYPFGGNAGFAGGVRNQTGRHSGSGRRGGHAVDGGVQSRVPVKKSDFVKLYEAAA